MAAQEQVIEAALNRMIKVNDMLDAGFKTKSAKKCALDNLNRAYSITRESIKDTEISYFHASHDHEGNVLDAEGVRRFRAIDDCLPFDLYQWRTKHAQGIQSETDEHDELVAVIADLVELRSTVKDAPVNSLAPKQSKATDEKAKEVQASIMAEMKRNEANYMRGIDLRHQFGNMRITANVHMVTNQFGTTFLRAFYYMDGKLTPLNVIIAAAQAKLEN